MEKYSYEWMQGFPAAVTVADRDGVIVAMNDKACATFTGSDTDRSLVGTSLWHCHKPESINKIKHMLATGENNIYSIEKLGVKKMIVQQPILENGDVCGIVEISIVLPADMPHYVRS